MSFINRNEDVFLLSVGGIETRGSLHVRETKEADAQPIALTFLQHGAEPAPLDIELHWNAISATRAARGDRVDFSIKAKRSGAGTPGILEVRLPFLARDVWDPVFGTIGSVALATPTTRHIRGAELGFGDGEQLAFVVPMPTRDVMTMASAWRFLEKPKAPWISIRLHLAPDADEISFRLGRAFAGQRFDPYIFVPSYELDRALNGTPDFSGFDEIAADFERTAAALPDVDRYTGMQAFVRPYAVMRRGAIDFQMLIGTPNSMSWYGETPEHHIELYNDDRYVRPGDRVLDCGAHAGQMATFFTLLAGNTGKVLAFDPFPQNTMQIEAQARLNRLGNLSAIRSGIGKTYETLQVSVGGQSTGSRSAHMSDKIDIELKPIDEYTDFAPTFIKLDIEGAEVAALRGAQHVLRTFKPRMFIEVHTAFLKDFDHSLADLFEAIPLDALNVEYMVEGVDYSWRTFAEGQVPQTQAPMLVRTSPRT